MQLEFADFPEGVGVGAEGDVDSGVNAHFEKVRWGLVAMEVDFGGDIVFFEHFHDGREEFFRLFESCPIKNPERMRKYLDA